MNRKINYALLFFTVLFSFDLKAYDWDKCRRAWMHTPVYGLVAISTMSPVQYISSWGACSATGLPESSKEAFFNDNYNFVRRDFALNYGEFRDAFLDLFACNNEGRNFLNSQIRKNFEIIFANNTGRKFIDDEGVEQNFYKLMDVINKEPFIYINCKSMK